MALGTIAPSPWFTGLDNLGHPLVGGLLYTYAAGTTTPLATYADVGLTTPNANPVVLDSAGRATLFLSNSNYKFVLNDASGNLIRTADNIASVQASGGGVVSEILFMGGDPTSPITATAYPSGATYDKLHAGSAILLIDSANLVGTYALECMGLGNGGTVSASIVDLDDGTPDTPLATATSSSATGQRIISGTITFAAPGTAKNYGLKVKVSAGDGFIWSARLVRTS